MGKSISRNEILHHTTRLLNIAMWETYVRGTPMTRIGISITNNGINGARLDETSVLVEAHRQKYWPEQSYA